MFAQLGRDLNKIQRRILDHRVFVNGEIEEFLNNFEVKRNDKEVESLFQVTETVGSLKYELSDRCIALGTAHLADIDKEVKQLLGGVNSFLAVTQIDKPESEEVLKARKDREQRKLNFLDDIQHKFKRVDNSFEEKEEEIVELYSDLELKLNIRK